MRVGRRAHLPLDALGELGGVAGHEVAEVLGDLPVLLGVDAPDAGGGALVDVAEQARPAALVGALEDAGATGAHREDAQEEVEGLPDRPGVAEGAEVAGALALGPAHHLGAGELLTERDGQEGVRLVVAVLDVEPRVELLDPAVLELERFDLGRDDGPLDAGAGPDHRGRARVQGVDVLEVGGQPRAQRLGLADVDDPAVLVAEPVHPRVDRDLPWPGAVRRRVSHRGHPPEGAPPGRGRYVDGSATVSL